MPGKVGRWFAVLLNTLFLSSPPPWWKEMSAITAERNFLPSSFFKFNVKSTHPALIILQCLSLFLSPPPMFLLCAWDKMIDIIHDLIMKSFLKTIGWTPGTSSKHFREPGTNRNEWITREHLCKLFRINQTWIVIKLCLWEEGKKTLHP